jgi:hypothetical protein
MGFTVGANNRLVFALSLDMCRSSDSSLSTSACRVVNKTTMPRQMISLSSCEWFSRDTMISETK